MQGPARVSLASEERSPSSRAKFELDTMKPSAQQTARMFRQEGVRGNGIILECGRPGHQVRLDSRGFPQNPDHCVQWY